MVSFILTYALVGFVVFIITKDMGLALKWPYLVARSIIMFIGGLIDKRSN